MLLSGDNIARFGRKREPVDVTFSTPTGSPFQDLADKVYRMQKGLKKREILSELFSLISD
jgi:hypothetical protein